jgi:deoxyribose-phosphate aldolase
MQSNLAAQIDHTMLAMNMQAADALRLCAEAKEYGFASVCVPPYLVPPVAAALAGSSVKVCTVIGFPHGYHLLSIKLLETDLALMQGAQEIDLVVNLAAWFSGERQVVADEIIAITSLVQAKGALIKVIIETGYLSPDDLQALCELCALARVDFVKTSTGFGKEGANVAVVREMRRILPQNIQIKASGGIRDRAFALELLEAGASRIGTSSGIKMMQT